MTYRSSSSSRVYERFLPIVFVTLVAILLPTTRWTVAATNDGPGVVNALNSYIDRPSTDARPVLFRIAGIQYKVPRNYIVRMDEWKGGPQVLVALKVTFPEFRPLTGATASCLNSPPADRPRGCTSIEFDITRPYPVSDEEAFNNFSSSFLSATPRSASYGFEAFDAGPESARIVTYRKHTKQHLLVLTCFEPEPGERRPGVCNNTSHLADQNEVLYHLYDDQIKDAEQIDEGIRRLIESFRAGA
jgi:hypothetical protein